MAVTPPHTALEQELAGAFGLGFRDRVFKPATRPTWVRCPVWSGDGGSICWSIPTVTPAFMTAAASAMLRPSGFATMIPKTWIGGWHDWARRQRRRLSSSRACTRCSVINPRWQNLSRSRIVMAPGCWSTRPIPSACSESGGLGLSETDRTARPGRFHRRHLFQEPGRHRWILCQSAPRTGVAATGQPSLHFHRLAVAGGHRCHAQSPRESTQWAEFAPTAFEEYQSLVRRSE